MMTKTRRVLLSIFTFYLLIFSLIRMDHVGYSDLSYSAKFIFLIMISLIEFGIIYYSSCIWMVDEYFNDPNDKEEIKTYNKTMIHSCIYSLVAIGITLLDIRLASSYYSGLMFRFVVISDLLCFVIYTVALVNFAVSRSLAWRNFNED